MHFASHTPISANEPQDVVLHLDIMCRAYELYEWRHDTANSADVKLQAELPRVAYAVSEIQKHSNGEVEDTKAVRAARVYLAALISFLRCE
jgi:hypothetical protein